ncbi:MAG: hypothetical protein RMM31_03615 [Anaerolineae bacterium]|nr:hypothetical protein [Thermoflexales bacterium]MDW8395311.1 hypothetical protein [Anaerolineae bacterium]
MQEGSVLEREVASRADGGAPAIGVTHAKESQAPDLDDELDGEHVGFSPRGIAVFLFLMLVGYALYWAYLWFITVIERGVNG